MSSDRAPPVGNGKSLDASLARAIDAMSHLREDLRREGILQLADLLDDVLVKCLTLYVDREDGQPPAGKTAPENGPASDSD